MDTLALSAMSWSLADVLPTRRLKRAVDGCGLFSACMPPPSILRITLVTASGVELRSGFYFEAWTEPSAGHPKNSRIHHRRGGTADLGCEQLELDWFGDEREIVLHLVEFSGSKQSRDLPVAELRVPHAAVLRYAGEANGQGDVRFGTRSFKMTPLARQDALQRKRRFQDMLLPSSLATRIFTKIGEEQGLHIPSNEELERLREENRALREENSELWTTSGLQGSKAFASSTLAAGGNLDSCKHAATVAVRFEVLPGRHGVASDSAGGLPFRKASFQEEIRVR